MKPEQIPMVCISLDRRKDRWDRFQLMAKAAGVSVERLPAVDARGFGAAPHQHPAISLTTAHNVYYGQRRSHYEIDKAGAIGCSLSHFAAWNKLRSSGAPAIVVFEDDAVIPKDFGARFATMVAQLPAEWDVVTFTNTRFSNNTRGCKPLRNGTQWESCTSLMGAHGYMVSRRGAERLLAKAYPIELHVDAYLAFMSRLEHIKMLWHPLIEVHQGDQGSDINHGAQGILDIPTDMERAGVMVLDAKSVVGVMAMSAVVGGLIALAWRPGK
jgi:glycosyl transferase family 25